MIYVIIHMNLPTVVVVWSADTEQDPMRFLGMKAFLWPPFLDYRK